MIGNQVGARAADGAMSVAELRELVAALERAEVPGSAVLRARVGWRGTVRSLSAATGGSIPAATPVTSAREPRTVP